MPELSLAGVVVVAAVAFAVPLLLGLLPRLRLPSVVLEIVVGIVLGPSLLDWVHVDVPLQVLSLLGLAFLLFLAGLEIDVHQLRGRLLGLVTVGFAVSFAIGLAVSGGLAAVGLVDTPLLVAIILTATSLGVVIPVLKDAGQVETGFGQLVIAAASIADFGAVILLSLFFSREASGPGAQLLLIGGALLRVVDRDEMMTHPKFRVKLEALGYGFLVPFFFVVSGIRFNLQALTGDPTNLRLVPLFLVVLLVVRGLPAWLYRSRVGSRRSVVAGLLQATSLPFIVAATQIGVELGKLDQATGAALVAAGLLSVLFFPLASLTILRGAGTGREGGVGSEAEPTSV